MKLWVTEEYEKNVRWNGLSIPHLKISGRAYLHFEPVIFVSNGQGAVVAETNFEGLLLNKIIFIYTMTVAPLCLPGRFFPCGINDLWGYLNDSQCTRTLKDEQMTHL
jgi:hypothetical protein